MTASPGAGSLIAAPGASSLLVVEHLGSYADAWDDLVAAGSPPSLGSRSWWLHGIATSSSRFLLVVQGDRLLGGLGVEIERRWTVPRITLIGGRQLGAMHADAVVRRGHEAEVVARLRAWFRAHRSCVVEMHALRAEPLLRQVLPSSVEMLHDGKAPVVRLPGTYEAYLRDRSKSWRSGTKRARVRLADQGYHHRVLTESEVELGLRALRRLHGARFGARSKFLPNFDRFAVAARAGVARGELAFHVLACDDDVIAIDAVIEVDGFADDFQGGFDPADRRTRGGGGVLIAAIIESLCTRGFRALDLETDANDYKMRLTDEVRQVVILRGGWGPGARRLRRLDRLVAFSRRLVRGVRRRGRGLVTRLGERLSERGRAPDPPPGPTLPPVARVELRSELGPFRGAWDELVAAGEPPRPTLRSWWAEGVAGPEASFVLVVRGEQLLGGMALDIGRHRGIPRFRLLGSDLRPVHVDLLARPEAQAEVEQQLRGWFRSHRSAIVEFDGLRPDARLQAILPASLRRRELPGNPYVEVPPDMASYLGGKSRNFRSDIRRPSNRLEAEGFAYRRLAPTEVAAGLAALRRLHVGLHGESSTFAPNLERFARAALSGTERGELAFHTIARGGQIIAIDAVIEFGGYALDYQTGRDDGDPMFRGVGSMLLARMLESYVERGDVRYLDLGRHTAAYKLRWADGVWSTGVLEGSWGPAPRALERARQARARLRRARERLGLRGAAGKNSSRDPDKGPRNPGPSTHQSDSPV